MTLQASAPITLNDIYDEAVSGGYSGARSLNDLILWGGWANLPGGANSILDFLGVSAGSSSSTFVDEFSLSQTSGASDIFFKPDGTKMYVIEGLGDIIYQYSLSTAWDISTASYDSKTTDVTSEESLARAFYIKSDGTKLYVVGTNAEDVFQYTLSTAWDISTASYDSKSYSIGSSPQGIFFKSDGTKMYVYRDTGSSIYQYSLSTAWDVSTASYDSKNASVSGDIGLFIKSDGTKFWMIDLTGVVYEYALSTAWDISTASLTTSEDIGTSSASGIYWSSDGSKYFVLDAIPNAEEWNAPGTFSL